jgi:hypothetical protein
MGTAFTLGKMEENTRVGMSKTKSMVKALTLTLMAVSIKVYGVMVYNMVWVV